MKTICPYCRTPIEGDDPPGCPDCGMPHHLECWNENNGCSIPGCSQSPEDEPKMKVSAGESGHSAKARRMEETTVATRERVPVTSNKQCAAKNRTVFMILGLLMGLFGIHNFYAGYMLRGTIQLLLTCLTLFYGAFISWPWAIVEILLVSRDAVSRPME